MEGSRHIIRLDAMPKQVGMRLYHGSNVVVKSPDTSHSRKELDFGPGFYTTSNVDQAVRFSQKVALKRKGQPVVSVYDFDESAMDDLRIKVFDRPDHEWLFFVIANRRGECLNADFDIIQGPVANDDVYGTISLFESGFYTEEETLNHLKIKDLFNQYVFVSERSVEHLCYRGILADGI